jgi:hypothetical protein
MSNDGMGLMISEPASNSNSLNRDLPTAGPRRHMENEPGKRGGDKKALVYPALSLLQITSQETPFFGRTNEERLSP